MSLEALVKVRSMAGWMVMFSLPKARKIQYRQGKAVINIMGTHDLTQGSSDVRENASR